MIEPGHAQALAERLHEGACERDGTPLLRHVERVARAVTGDARVVAWLHEVFEWSEITEQQLIQEGVSEDELGAIRLLTRTSGPDDDAYFAYMDLIARAPGGSGSLAREVKLADLEDRQLHPSARDDRWLPPYTRALSLLRGAIEEGSSR